MARVEGRFEKELEVRTPLRLEVKTGSGDIEVQRGEEGRLKVSAEFEVRAGSCEEAQDLARRIEEDPPIAVEGDLVRIGELGKYGLSPQPLGRSAVLDFSISAPPETGVQVSSGSGDQHVSGLKGPVTAKAGSGDIQIEDIDADVDAGAGSGDVSVARVRSSVTVGVGHGDVDLSETSGPVSAKVGSGDVAVEDLGGNIQVSIGRGDIALESPVPDGAEWVLEAGSGDASLVLPRDSRFKLRAVSTSGEIETDFRLNLSEGTGMKKLEGQVGENPTALVSIKMAHGDVEIRAK
jgi:DUF4097 and DUF4098 domain-containing protein YvlB